jgi:uncharacterized tellurite resistance protein B-like protein
MKREDHLHRPMPPSDLPGTEDRLDAAARVLVLAIMADGRLGACEVQALDRREAYPRLGLDRERFYRVMREVCTDLLDHQARTGDSMFRLDSELAERWIDAVQDPALRQTVADLAFDVIRSDGVLDPAESRLFWRVLDRWGWTLDEVRTARWAAAATEDDACTAAPAPRAARVHRLSGAMVIA